MLCISAIAFPQACPIVTNVSFTSSPAGSSLTVSYTGHGAKHIEYYIYCDGVQAAHGCFDTKGNGTQSAPPVTCGGVLGYSLIPGTGTCINGTTCGDTIRSPEGGPLPVTLNSFSAQRNSSKVTLTWQTQQELNSKSFEIQRAYGTSAYQTVGTVASNGNTSVLHTYSFTDNSNNSKGVSFYRIKMVDADGKFSYTYIKSVKGSGATTSFIVFPNPSFGNARITLTDVNEPTLVQLLDGAGRMVKSLTITNSNTVELTNLKSGTYIVKTTGKVSGVTSVEKLSVVN